MTSFLPRCSLRQRRRGPPTQILVSACSWTPARSGPPLLYPLPLPSPSGAVQCGPIAIKVGDVRAVAEMPLLTLDGDLNQPNAPECTMTGVFTVPMTLDFGRQDDPSSAGPPAGPRGGYGPERAAAEKRGLRTPSLVSLAQAKILCRSIAHQVRHHWRRV